MFFSWTLATLFHASGTHHGSLKCALPDCRSPLLAVFPDCPKTFRQSIQYYIDPGVISNRKECQRRAAWLGKHKEGICWNWREFWCSLSVFLSISVYLCISLYTCKCLYSPSISVSHSMSILL